MEQVAGTIYSTSTAELLERAAACGTTIAAASGDLLEITGEIKRREGFRLDGATSMAAWLTEALGLADASARGLSDLAEKLWDLPVLAQALRQGVVSLDKVRAAAEYAKPETEAEVLEQILECSVRQVQDIAKSKRTPKDPDAGDQYDGRYLRFNKGRRTISIRLPEDQFAQVETTVSAIARAFGSDGETRWDQRLADALVQLCQTGPGDGSGRSRAHVVLHADLAILRGGSGVAELEHFGLLSPEAARRLLCEGDVALALDDAFGHTMYEGRARRFATDAQRREVQRRDRHCRFPGCSNDTFTQVHHLVQWRDGGRSDLDNLALLCDHHHHKVHEGAWQVSGNANGTLRFVGPTNREMTSRPSPLWSRRQ
jgi:Domain of unknown function (DUF222)/HNH endonuclease